MRKEGLQQLAQHVQLYESQDGHHKRHSLGHKIEVTGGHAHQRECHQYCATATATIPARFVFVI